MSAYLETNLKKYVIITPPLARVARRVVAPVGVPEESSAVRREPRRLARGFRRPVPALSPRLV